MSNFVLTTVTFTVGFAQTAKLFFLAYLTKINLVFWCQNSTIYASIHDLKSGENQILFLHLFSCLGSRRSNVQYSNAYRQSYRLTILFHSV